MISYLGQSEIDKVKWDDCISRSLNRRVYAYSWYLDIVSPGWEALVSDDYSSVFPLTGGKKAGVPYLFQPFFAQQLGLFSINEIHDGLADRFLRAIPGHFRYIDIQGTTGFSPSNENVVKIERLNHELSLSGSYKDLSEGYSQNTRRNIRKALDAGVNMGRKVRTEELVKLFRGNFGEREGKLKPLHYERMGKLMNYCQAENTGIVRGTFDEQGLLCSAAFFLTDKNRIYFLFAASSSSARENGAMFQLIDNFIRENAGCEKILDFEGGNDSNLGRFYKSFGATEVIYQRLLWNRLPAMLNAVLKLTRATRQQR